MIHSTDNTNSSTMSEEEFDRLLETFINQGEEEERTKDDKEKQAGTATADSVPAMHECASDGFTYSIPYCTQPEYQYESISILVNGEKWEKGCPLYVAPGEEAKLLVEMIVSRNNEEEEEEEDDYSRYFGEEEEEEEEDEDDDEREEKKRGPLNILLYRRGEKEPVADLSCTEVDGCVQSRKTLPLPVAGEYFLLIGNLTPPVDDEEEKPRRMGSCLRYDLTLLHELKRAPQVGGTRLKSRGGDDLREKGNALLVELKLAQRLELYRDLKALCLSDDFATMGEGYLCCTRPGHSTARPTLCIESEKIWCDGPYHIVVQQNRLPFLQIDFEVTQGRITGKQERPIGPGDWGYTLLRELEGRSDAWSRIKESIGFSPAKKSIIELYRQSDINILRNQHSLRMLKCNFNFLLCGRKSCDTERFIRSLNELLGNSGTLHSHTVAEFLEEPRFVTTESLMQSFFGENCSEGTLCLSGLHALVGSGGSKLVDELVKWLDRAKESSLVLAGDGKSIQRALEHYPQLAALFPAENRLLCSTPTASELANHIAQRMKQLDLYPDTEALLRLQAVFEEAAAEKQLDEWDSKRAEHYLNDGIVPRYRKRIVQSNELHKLSAEEMGRVTADDIAPAFAAKGEHSHAMEQLGSMAGMEQLKEIVSGACARQKLNALRCAAGLPAEEIGSMHMIFTGNPGTGKTTAATLLAAALHSAGVLSKGGVIRTERREMVGQYIGETEKNMCELIERARGNVLFVDEAYTLADSTDSNSRDFGRRALESLLTLLSDPNPDTLVIFAGYEKEMKQMLDVNQGLEGRFPHKVNFADYTAGQLADIARSALQSRGYTLTREADSLLLSDVADSLSRSDKNFSNARWVLQFAEKGILGALAQRLNAKAQLPTRDELTTIELCDVERGYERYRYRPTPPSKPRPAIGFRG